MMLCRQDGGLIPVYIGRAEKLGRGDGNLSPNISDARPGRSGQRFGRWGYGESHHVGGLSSVVVDGQKNPRAVGSTAVQVADHRSPTHERSPGLDEGVEDRQHEPVEGVWPDSSGRLEFILIAVASAVFPEQLLNVEGVNRR
jgi:hypothetical protein